MLNWRSSQKKKKKQTSSNNQNVLNLTEGRKKLFSFCFVLIESRQRYFWQPAYVSQYLKLKSVFAYDRRNLDGYFAFAWHIIFNEYNKWKYFQENNILQSVFILCRFSGYFINICIIIIIFPSPFNNMKCRHLIAYQPHWRVKQCIICNYLKQQRHWNQVDNEQNNFEMRLMTLFVIRTQHKTKPTEKRKIQPLSDTYAGNVSVLAWKMVQFM